MQDRVPTYPGRVQLIPVSGQSNVYDMTMADDAMVAGTPLSKANLLTDATAALLGLSGNPSVNDALAAAPVAAMTSYIWSRYTGSAITESTSTLTNVSMTNGGTQDAVKATWRYADSYVVKPSRDGGAYFELVNPTTAVLYNFTGHDESSLLGKYCMCGQWPGIMIYVPANATFTGTTTHGTCVDGTSPSGGGWYLNADSVTVYALSGGVAAFDTFVYSHNSAAYTDGSFDGTYWYLGGEYLAGYFDGHLPKVQTGSYIGTGVYGSGNPNSLTFDFEPKFIYVLGYGYEMIMLNPAVSAVVVSVSNKQYTYSEHVTWLSNGVEWYYTSTSSTGDIYQVNYEGYEYCYIAIG